MLPELSFSLAPFTTEQKVVRTNAADGRRKTRMRISGRMQPLSHEGRAPTLPAESGLCRVPERNTP